MGSVKKKRLDQILVENNFCNTREKAKRIIMTGKVFVDGKKVDKPGTKFKDDIFLEIKDNNEAKYVSRGGLKLEKAIETFEIDIRDRVCLDVGASTGGFTHCLLLKGARHVYSLDVGYGQIAWELRCSDKVTVLERTNIRHVSREKFQLKPDLACVDVSFISLELVLPKLNEIIHSPKSIILLVKPQFELDKDKIGKKGVVKELSYHFEAIKKVIEAALEINFSFISLTYSPIKGPKGNIEYLAYFEQDVNNNILDGVEVDSEIIKGVVDEAHDRLSCCD